MFSPPSLSNSAPITDVAANWNDNEENKGLFLSGQGDDYVMISNVYNVGNQNVGSFSLTSSILYRKFVLYIIFQYYLLY